MITWYLTGLGLMLLAGPEVLDIFRELTAEALGTWDSQALGLLGQMPSAQELQTAQLDTGRALPRGETFVIRFYRSQVGDGYVLNDLPRGLTINLAWHYLVLIDHIHRRFSPEQRAIAHKALARWWDIVFSPSGADSSFAGLRRLTVLVNAAYFQTMSLPAG